MTNEQINGQESIVKPDLGPKGKVEKKAQSLETLKALKETGNTSTIMNELGKHIDLYPKGSLPKEYALIMADIYNKEPGQRGGYPKDALLNFDKFEGLTAQEMCMELINSGGTTFAFTDLEDDLQKNIKNLEDQEASLRKNLADGEKEGGAVIDEINKRIAKLSNKNDQIKTVLSSINKRELLEAMSKVPDVLVPEKIDFFTEGKQSLSINHADLISKLINGKYSRESIRSFVGNAPEGSLDKSLLTKLNALGGVAENLDQVYPKKFQA